MKSDKTTTLLLAAIIVVGFGAVFGLSNFIEQNRPPLPEGYIDTDLSLQGEKLKGYALGFEGLAADWYWIQALQYIGVKVLHVKKQNTKINIENLRPLNPRLLYPFLDNATTLDPRFMAAYSYGAVVLPAINEKHAIKIARKGIKNNPEQWRLYQHLGYIYWRLKQYDKAAKVYTEGSKIAGVPTWMKSLSAKMKSEGGQRETARTIYKQMFDEASDTQTKENAMIRLLQLDSLDERDGLDKTLKLVKKRTGRCVNSWKDIFSDLKAIKLPHGREFRIDQSGNIVDPSNVPYILDKQECAAKLNLEKTKIPAR